MIAFNLNLPLMKTHFLILGTTSLLIFGFVLAPNPVVAQDASDEPVEMSRGKGKGKGGGGGGKGKGKGRRGMDDEPPAPNPAPGPISPDAPLEERKLAFFEQRILPVLEAKCYNCHESGGKMKGGLALDSAAALLSGGDTGPALIPGNAEGSLLYQSITYEDPDFEMPPKERLTDSVVKDFKTWIDIGAPDNRTRTPKPAFDPSSGFVTTITAIDGDQVTFLKPETSGSSSMGGGKGKGKGRSRGSNSGDEMTLPASDAVLVTTATPARRTGDLLIGIELAGGLQNEHFRDLGRFGVKARVVIEGVDVTEINVLVSQEENDAPIAVKPKRPPMKTAF